MFQHAQSQPKPPVTAQGPQSPAPKPRPDITDYASL